jgi:hypothetical protein
MKILALSILDFILLLTDLDCTVTVEDERGGRNPVPQKSFLDSLKCAILGCQET